jgi:hypothetical protein
MSLREIQDIFRQVCNVEKRHEPSEAREVGCFRIQLVDYIVAINLYYGDKVELMQAFVI